MLFVSLFGCLQAAQERAVEQSRRQWEREQQSTHEAEVTTYVALVVMKEMTENDL